MTAIGARIRVLSRIWINGCRYRGSRLPYPICSSSSNRNAEDAEGADQDHCDGYEKKRVANQEHQAPQVDGWRLLSDDAREFFELYRHSTLGTGDTREWKRGRTELTKEEGGRSGSRQQMLHGRPGDLFYFEYISCTTDPTLPEPRGLSTLESDKGVQSVRRGGRVTTRN